MREIKECPNCGEPFLEALKFSESAWCDNCCAEVSWKEDEEKDQIMISKFLTLGEKSADNTGIRTGGKESH